VVSPWQAANLLNEPEAVFTGQPGQLDVGNEHLEIAAFDHIECLPRAGADDDIRASVLQQGLREFS
jgi:hypothetical protein